MLKGKTVLLGVTGSVAAYKAAALASALVKQGADVHALLTRNATQFISPITFESLTGNKAPVDTFDRNFSFSIEHVALAKQADLCVIAPASANVAAKLACGIADDMLTTTVLACACPKLIAPAMNTRMYQNPVTQDNLQRLRDYGWTVIDPAFGHLACGDTGAGKMPEPEAILEEIVQQIAFEKDLRGLRILVSAGATQEALDPVRYLTNHSTGKMGYAIAQAAARRGAQVTLVSGQTTLSPPPHLHLVKVTTAQQMFEAVVSRAAEQDIIIKAAAVADYRPLTQAQDKLKKGDGDFSIALARTQDILQYLGDHRHEDQFLCGFSMETCDLLENSRKKLEKKHIDMIAANSLREEGAGFAFDTNRLTLITADSTLPLPLLSKEHAAHRLLDEIATRRGTSHRARPCNSANL